MSVVYLPIGKKAHTPYRIAPAGVEVFTLEELCLYITTQASLMEKSFMNEQLVEFIASSLGLEPLAAKLRVSMQRENSLQAFCRILLQEANFLSQPEFDYVSEQLYESENSTESEKMIRKIDALLTAGEFTAAITQCYFALHKCKESEDEQLEELEAILYSKQGQAFARLFYFEPAAEKYKLSAEKYAVLGDGIRERKALQQYLLSLRLFYGEKKFHSFVESHPRFLELSLMAEQKLARASVNVEEMENTKRITERDMEKLRREFERQAGL